MLVKEENTVAEDVRPRGAASRVSWVGKVGRVAPVVAAILAILAFLLSDAPARWLVLDDPLPPTFDAALVMAGDPGYERTTTAARLVVEGRARLLILTGGEPGPGDSASSLQAWALRKGVPEDRIRVESVSQGTHSSMLAIRPILDEENVRTLVLVTSPYHHRRAFQTAVRAFGPRVTVFNHPARPAGWKPGGWWRTSYSRRIVLSENVKLAYYALRGWI